MAAVIRHLAVLIPIFFILLPINRLASQQPSTPPASGAAGSGSGRPSPMCQPSALGSPFIPVDNWIYSAIWRLYGMGYLDDVYLGMRPWTRARVSQLLEEAGGRIDDATANGKSTAAEAEGIYTAIEHELQPDIEGPCLRGEGSARLESVYSVARAISGTPLRDSYHIGSTIVNDYGRPYQNGFNNYSGASGYTSLGRFTLYARGEFQGAPSAAGYPTTLAQAFSNLDQTTFLNPATGLPYPQTTIPLGPIATATQGRLLEAYVSAQFLGHVFSFGKQDKWLGQAQGGTLAFSNNAQNFYAFQFDRVEPLHVPLLSRIFGPFRYEFLIGALRGHTLMPNPAYIANPSPTTPNVINPGDPWVHVEKVSFRPTENLEFGFERTAMFGGEGHSPVTLHTFLKSFFSTVNVGAAVKDGRDDPGARFGAFDFSYRLPFVRNWFTIYTDAFAHDDVSPVDAPRRASVRPGLYLSHFPGVPKLDMRIEGVSTDPNTSTSQRGEFMYWEQIEKQGYTNQGQIFGDWMGREDKGGQAWITYHLSGDEWLQASMRRQKADPDFIAGGATLDDIGFQVVKRIGPDFSIDGNFTVEHWLAPIYLPGQQTVTTTNVQLTWWPQRKVSF